MALCCTRGGSGWVLGAIYSQKEARQHRLPREVSSLEVLKKHGDVAMRAMVSRHGGGGLAVGLDH